MTLNLTVSTAEQTTASPDRENRDSESLLQFSVWGSSESTKAMREWKSLEERIGSVALSCSWFWTQTWLDHYGDLIPHRFVAGLRNGQVHGICLVTEGRWEKNGPLRIKTLHLGTSGEPDEDSVCVEYNQVLVDDDCRHEFIHGVLKSVSEDPHWEEFRLDGFLESDAASFLDQGNWVQPFPSKSHYCDLKSIRESSGDVFSLWKPATRKRFRHKLKAFGPVEFEWADTIEQAQSILSDLMILHQTRWNAVGIPGAYASERFVHFQRNLIRRGLSENKVALVRLRQDGQLVACQLMLIDRNRALSYQGGWSPYKSKLSPGIIVYLYCLKEFLQRGFDAYDFLKGDNLTKQRLATSSNTLLWAKIRRPRLKFRIVDALRTLQHSFKNSGIS